MATPCTPRPLEPPLNGNGANCTPARSVTRLLLSAHWAPSSQEKSRVVTGRTFNASSTPMLRSAAALAGSSV